LSLFCFCFVFVCLFVCFCGEAEQRKHFLDKDSTPQTFFQPAIKIHDFDVSTAYVRSFGFVFASKELKRDRFFEADTQYKFKRLLKAGL